MNLREQLLEEFSPLHREPEFLLREELRDVEKYHAVLMAIAMGSHTTRDIASATGLPERSLHYWVQQLSELGYVGRHHPLTDKRRNKRQVRYVLEDALLRFWFRFVFPNQTHLQHLGARQTFLDRIKPGLNAYFGHCFERLCRSGLPQLYVQEEVDASYEIGEFWSRETQIDVVGLRQDNWTDLGECKWGAVRSIPSLRRELQGKAVHFPNARNATLCLRFFVRRLPRQRPADSAGERWHELEDLYRG